MNLNEHQDVFILSYFKRFTLKIHFVQLWYLDSSICHLQIITHEGYHFLPLILESQSSSAQMTPQVVSEHRSAAICSSLLGQSIMSRGLLLFRIDLPALDKARIDSMSINLYTSHLIWNNTVFITSFTTCTSLNRLSV